MLEVWCQGLIAFLPLNPFPRFLSIYWLTQFLSSKISAWLFSRVAISLLALSATSFSLAVYLQPVWSHRSFLKISLFNSLSGSSPILISLDLVTEEWKAFRVEFCIPASMNLLQFFLGVFLAALSWRPCPHCHPEHKQTLLTRIIQKWKKLYFSVRASSSVVKYRLF